MQNQRGIQKISDLPAAVGTHPEPLVGGMWLSLFPLAPWISEFLAAKRWVTGQFLEKS